MTKKCSYCGREWQDNLPKCWDGVDGCGAFLGIANSIGDVGCDSIEVTTLAMATDFFKHYATVVPMKSQTTVITIDDGRRIELWARVVIDKTKAFIQGTGVEEPLGIVNSQATISIAREYKHTVTVSDLWNMMERFSPTDFGLWLINPNSLLQILNIRMGDGSAAVNGSRMTLFNFPVIPTNACPQLGERGDVTLADLRFYLVGEYDDMCDGCPTIQYPIRLDGGYSHSPFVALDSGVVI